MRSRGSPLLAVSLLWLAVFSGALRAADDGYSDLNLLSVPSGSIAPSLSPEPRTGDANLTAGDQQSTGGREPSVIDAVWTFLTTAYAELREVFEPPSPEQIAARYGVTLTATSSSTDPQQRGQWTDDQVRATADVLEALPPRFRSPTKVIARSGEDKGHTLGTTAYGQKTVCIYDAVGNDSSNFSGVLVHEMGHVFFDENPDVSTRWMAEFWPTWGQDVSPRYPTINCPEEEAAKWNPWEDFARSVRAYVQRGSDMRRVAPERYAFIRDNVMDGKEFAGSRWDRSGW